MQSLQNKITSQTFIICVKEKAYLNGDIEWGQESSFGL